LIPAVTSNARIAFLLTRESGDRFENQPPAPRETPSAASTSARTRGFSEAKRSFVEAIADALPQWLPEQAQAAQDVAERLTDAIRADALLALSDRIAHLAFLSRVMTTLGPLLIRRRRGVTLGATGGSGLVVRTVDARGLVICTPAEVRRTLRWLMLVDPPALRALVVRRLHRERWSRIAPRKRQQGVTRLSPASIRRILCPLKALLNEAFEDELIATDAGNVRVVVRDPTGQRIDSRPIKTMTAEQVTAVLAKLPERADRVPVPGQDGRSDLRGFRGKWGDIEQTADGPVFTIRRQYYRGQLRDEAKTEAGARAVALMPSLMRDLLKHRATTPYAAGSDPISPR
jgi:hypothetical protein